VKDVLPFLATVATPSRPLGAALRSIPTVEATSPWSPKPTAPAAAPVPAIDVDKIRNEAIEAGRAQGLGETEALRAQLAKAIEQFTAARDRFAKPAIELVADAAATVIEAWTQTADKRALFAPLVEAWVSKGRATANCHPDDVAALREAIGDREIDVVADPTMTRSDLRINDATRELAHAWEPRLRELREAITAALTEP
jgi:flagellar biosynthesis/type III secretory pathway protein FliH